MNKLYKQHLEIIIGQVRKLEEEHPKADVFFDIERMGVQVVYPLPKDFYKLQKTDIGWIGDWTGFGGDPNNPFPLKKNKGVM